MTKLNTSTVSSATFGKLWTLYADGQINRTDMGKFVASPDAPDCQNKNIIQQVTAFPPQVHNGQTHYGNIHGSPVYWQGPDAGRIYARGENSRLKAYRFTAGKLQDVNNPKQSDFLPPPGMPGGMITVSANGNKAGTGIVWAVVPLNGDANQQRGVLGTLFALDAQDVSRTLWSSEMVSQRNRLGPFRKVRKSDRCRREGLRAHLPRHGTLAPVRRRRTS